MNKNRILKLAIEALERQKSQIDSEIALIRSELKEIRSSAPKAIAKEPIKKSTKSSTARKAQSEKMKKIWAAKKTMNAKSKPKPRKANIRAKVKSKTDAEKKALSLKMKEVWKKRKAAAAAKNNRAKSKSAQIKK